MILTVTPNPGLDRFYPVEGLWETFFPVEEGTLIRARRSLVLACTGWKTQFVTKSIFYPACSGVHRRRT